MAIVNLDQQFMAAVIEAHDTQASGAEVLPMLLAQACVKVLHVTGAGISITDGLRVPLGASDAMAAQAEALQTTLGEGPCLDATATSEPLVADETSMAARWPMFHRELLARTPFRAVASVPLKSASCGVSARSTCTPPIPTLCSDCPSTRSASTSPTPWPGSCSTTRRHSSQDGTRLPVWMTNRPVAQRMNVWAAVGILIEHAGLTNADALTALRAYAYGHNASLDDIADHLTTQRLHPDALLA